MSTHWKSLVNQDYLGAYSLKPGEELTVTIRTVSARDVIVTGGKKKECLVASIEGKKPLVLNATNSKSIQKLYGPYVEEWAGKQITLYASTTQFGNEQVECLRIRAQVASQKEAITDERLDKAILSIVSGNYTESQLVKGFDLTEEQAATLRARISAGVSVEN